MPRFFFESTIEFIDHSFFFNIHEEIQQRGWTMKQKIVWSCLCLHAFSVHKIMIAVRFAEYTFGGN